MAAAIEMDVDQVDSSNKSAAAAAGGNRSSLAISKSSAAKISKATLRRPIVQQTKPMPTSKVYNTDPMGFRNLVQELTGYSPNVEQQEQQQQLPPPPPQQQQQQQSSTEAAAARSSPPAPAATVTGGAARPTNNANSSTNTTRLQRMAPPPLFSFSFKQQQSSPSAAGGGSGGVVSPSAHPLSPISKRVSPMPLLSFSPLPQLSPTDNIWANFESPNTAAFKKFAQSILDGSGGAGGGGGGSKVGFPWSPTFQDGMPSPGAGIPELFPDVKMMDSPDNVNSGSNSGSREFSFPEIRD